MGISAKLVMELRRKTGAGMMDCKKALIEKNGNLEDAVTYLREKGISKAAKKADRITSQGLVFSALSENKKVGAIIELNIETDFAAKNEDFKDFGQRLAGIIVNKNIKNLDDLKNYKLENGEVVEETLKALIAKIGENISIRRIARVEAPGFVSIYNHMGGKIGVLLAIDGELTAENEVKASDVAMHEAAMAPAYFDKSDVTQKDMDSEKSIMRKQLLEQGKPEKIIDNILIGKMRRFYEDNCLLQQKFVKDDKITVEQYLGNIKLISAERFKVGEGIEKRDEDFAAEVKAQMEG